MGTHMKIGIANFKKLMQVDDDWRLLEKKDLFWSWKSSSG